jgi:Zn-dependent protease with chaperone function
VTKRTKYKSTKCYIAGPDHFALLCSIAILFLSLLLDGCATFSAGGMSAEGARFRHAARQGWQSGKGMMIYSIHPEDFPQGSSFAAIRDANPSSEGAQILRDEVLTDVAIAKTVNELGLPAAIGFASSSVGQVQRLAMFYKTPPRALVFKRSSMDVQWLSLSQLYKSRVVADLSTVPRSVQRLVFNEGPLSPPWSVTIPPDLRDAFAVPSQPSAAPSIDVDVHDYVAVANDLEARLPHAVNVLNQRRAEAALARLEPVARVTGLNWRVVVVNAVGPMGFGVPDGTLFVSDGLIQGLDDTELAAVLAHLMGHERYQHARACARRRNIMVATLFAGGAFQLAGGGMGFFPIPTGGYLALIAHSEFGYTQEYEVEANYAATMILSNANLPPDALFDAMVKLSGRGQPGTLAFDCLHHLPAAAVQYGLMLDAGLSGRQP